LLAIIQSSKEFKKLASFNFYFFWLVGILIIAVCLATIVCVIFLRHIFSVRVITDKSVSEGQKVFVKDYFVEAVNSLIVFILQNWCVCSVLGKLATNTSLVGIIHKLA